MDIDHIYFAYYNCIDQYIPTGIKSKLFMMFQITSQHTNKVEYNKEDDNGLFKCFYISK